MKNDNCDDQDVWNETKISLIFLDKIHWFLDTELK